MTGVFSRVVRRNEMPGRSTISTTSAAAWFASDG